MPNSYGTPEYYRFREDRYGLNKHVRYTIADTRYYTYGKYKIKYDTCRAETQSGDVRGDMDEEKSRSELTVYRYNNECYCCKDIYSDEGTFLYMFTYRGHDMLMFRKDDLYGYTLLDLDTLEEYDYFPQIVSDGAGESFIITEALLWNDVLLLFGCYWAGPFLCCLLDMQTHKTRFLGYDDIEDNGLKINGDILTVVHSDGSADETFTYDKVCAMLAESESCDL